MAAGRSHEARPSIRCTDPKAYSIRALSAISYCAQRDFKHEDANADPAARLPLRYGPSRMGAIQTTRHLPQPDASIELQLRKGQGKMIRIHPWNEYGCFSPLIASRVRRLFSSRTTDANGATITVNLAENIKHCWEQRQPHLRHRKRHSRSPILSHWTIDCAGICRIFICRFSSQSPHAILSSIISVYGSDCTLESDHHSLQKPGRLVFGRRQRFAILYIGAAALTRHSNLILPHLSPSSLTP